VILKGQMVTALHDKEIEATARAMLRETIERSGWYPALRGIGGVAEQASGRAKRKQFIERDVEQHWHLMMADARKRLEQCQKSP
jgi:hypothetical protein